LDATGCACDAGPATTETAASLANMNCELEGATSTNTMCTQGCQEWCASPDISSHRGGSPLSGTLSSSSYGASTVTVTRESE